MIPRAACFALLLSALAPATGFAQGTTLSFKIDDADLAYTRNPGFTYEIVTIAVTDPGNFRADATNVVSTGPRPPRAVGYAVFPIGVPVPTVFRWQDHRDDPNAVAARNEGNANTNNGVRLTNRAAGPLMADTYQLVVAPQDGNGRRGDFTLDVTLTGGTFVVLAPAPATSVFSGTTAGASRLVVVDASGVARDAGGDSIAARAERLSFTRTTGEDGAPLVTMSTRDSAGFMGDLYGWVELTGFYASDDADRSLRGYGLQIGADTELRPGLVAGLSIGVSDIETETAGTRIEGDVIYLQPYLAYRSGPIGVEASVIYGQGDFDQSGAGGDGTGETELFALTLSGGYDIALDRPGLLMTPMAGLVYGSEETEGTGGVLTGSDTVDFYQVSLGVQVRQAMAGGEAFFGLHLDHQEADSDTVLTGDILINDGTTARLEVGGRWELTNGTLLDTSLEFGGIGGDLSESSAALRATFCF